MVLSISGLRTDNVFEADRDSQLLNEIMPMIYHRFTEKTAEQWRQIYKASPIFGLISV